MKKNKSEILSIVFTIIASLLLISELFETKIDWKFSIAMIIYLILYLPDNFKFIRKMIKQSSSKNRDH